MERQILEWLASGDTGLSSEAMAFTAMGVGRRSYHPLDPGDFGRCLRLVRLVPAIRNHFGDIAKLSPQWEAIIANWDAIELSFIAEVGFYWEKGGGDQKTYELMKSVIDGAAKQASKGGAHE